MIEFQSVWKSFAATPVLRDLSFQAAGGERLVVLGASGSGKTTLLRLLAGFIDPDRGSILVGGEVVAAQGRSFRGPRERDLGMVFQDLALWPHLSVKGNLEFGLKARGVPRRERKERIGAMLQLLQMDGWAESRPEELSGGQRQRVALGRALVLQPGTLLMDEPLSSLDLELKARILNELLRIHERLGFTLLYITHDYDEALHVAQRLILLKDGRLSRSGAPDEMRPFLQEQRRRAFGCGSGDQK